MNAKEPIGFAFDDGVAILRAAGEETRLRLLLLLAETELTVSDCVDILGQSQPRVSRHLKLLLDAGLIWRVKEGSWAFFALATEGRGRDAARAAIALIDPFDPVIVRDRERLAEIRARRAHEAQSFFARHAQQWDRLRSLHVAEGAVEAAIRQSFGTVMPRNLLDIGTGTGRMLELFGPEIGRGIGVDSSPEMLAIARANLDKAGLRNCSVRQGDLFTLPFARDSFDGIIVHQVLHFLDDGARALREAARVLRLGGRLVVVDFAPHDLEFLRETQAHRRLGFTRETIDGWFAQCGLEPVAFEALKPDIATGQLTVTLWVGRDTRRLLDAPLPSLPVFSETA